jgi:hypothetical protein
MISTDAIEDWESEGGALMQSGGQQTNAMKSSSGKQLEQDRTGTPSWQERNLGRRDPVSSKAPEPRGYEPGSWQARNIGNGK